MWFISWFLLEWLLWINVCEDVEEKGCCVMVVWVWFGLGGRENGMVNFLV